MKFTGQHFYACRLHKPAVSHRVFAVILQQFKLYKSIKRVGFRGSAGKAYSTPPDPLAENQLRLKIPDRDIIFELLYFEIYKTPCSLAYAGFSKGGGAGNSENLRTTKTRIKNFPPVRFPAQNQVKTKKMSSSDLVRFLAQNWVKAKKKVFAQRLCAQTFCPSYKGGAMLQFCIVIYANYTILAIQTGG